MDYALGGGSSGGDVCDGGVRTLSSGATEMIVGGDTSVSVSEVTAAGEHGAIDWQPSGAHGNRQGP